MYRCGLQKGERFIHNVNKNSLLNAVKNGNAAQRNALRFNSTTRSSGSSAFYIGATATTLGAFVGGATAYAGYDTEFRKTVEDAIPLSKSLFTAIHGEIKDTKVISPIVEKDLSIPFEPEGLILPEKQEAIPILADEKTIESPIEVLEIKENETETPVVVEIPTDETEALAVVPEVDISKITSEDKSASSEGIVVVLDSEVNETEVKDDIVVSDMKVEEEQIEDFTIPPIDIGEEKPLSEEEIKELARIVDKEALEVLVSTTSSNIELLSNKANTLQLSAANSLRDYMKSFALLMATSVDDEEYQNKVQQVVDIEHKAQESVDAAKQSELSLLAELESLKNLVNTIRENGESSIADDAENAANICEKSLKDVLSEIDAAQKDFDFLLEYQQFVADSPLPLQNELNSFAGDLLDILERKEIDISQLSRDQAILALALKRKQMIESEELKMKRQQEIEELLDKQKGKLVKAAEEILTKELQQLRNEKDLERELQLKLADENHEKEMLSQLKRQASAHTEHLSEELAQQAKSLDHKHQTEMENKLDEQHKVYYRELEKKVQSISAIQSKITDVVDVETRQRHAQELWIASQALNGTLDVCTLNGRTRSLMPELISILQLGESAPTLSEIVDSFPEQAALFGVVPEKDLINRFKKVKNVCKKVAAVGEGDSIAMYLLSYVKSVFVFSKWFLTDVDAPVNVDELTSYEILAKAEYFIEQGDLETAAKLMSRLKGVARKMCGDWLNEVRLLLETKQTAMLLQAYAATLTAGME